jgi:hypothetical protein
MTKNHMMQLTKKIHGPNQTANRFFLFYLTSGKLAVINTENYYLWLHYGLGKHFNLLMLRSSTTKEVDSYVGQSADPCKWMALTFHKKVGTKLNSSTTTRNIKSSSR